MVAWKHFIVLFGGFQDTSSTTKYLNDTWLFDTMNYSWTPVVLPAHSQRPDPRSSFSLLPHEAGAVLYGGYSRVKSATVSAGSRNHVATKPVIHTDTWLLRVSPTDSGKLTRWERRKKPMNLPMPARVGVTMTGHKGRGIMFGGVHDTEKDEEGLESQFFGDLFAWGVERNRFFPLTLRKPRANQPSKACLGKQATGSGRRDRAKEDEEELLRNLARLGAPSSPLDSSDNEIDLAPVPESEPTKVELPISLSLPHPRFNAALAVQEDTLYIYSGTFEKGDREFTFDEMYSVDLVKLDGVRTLFARKDEIGWVDDEEDEDEDEGEDDEEDEEDEAEASTEEKLDSKAAEIARKKAEGQARKLKEQEEAAAAAAAEEEETPELEDNTPFPRPFESLRDFYARTSQIWQKIILTNVAAEGDSGSLVSAGRSIKELRKEAFAVAEERWWAVREEVRAAEDEQEESGIGEVLNLKDRETSGSGAAVTGGAGRRR